MENGIQRKDAEAQIFGEQLADALHDWMEQGIIDRWGCTTEQMMQHFDRPLVERIGFPLCVSANSEVQQ